MVHTFRIFWQLMVHKLFKVHNFLKVHSQKKCQVRVKIQTGECGPDGNAAWLFHRFLAALLGEDGIQAHLLDQLKLLHRIRCAAMPSASDWLIARAVCAQTTKFGAGVEPCWTPVLLSTI